MTIGVPWKTTNDAAVSHGSSVPLPFITEVRSNVNDGFVDWIEFDHLSSFAWNAIKVAVVSGHKSITFSFNLFSNES